MIALVGPSGKSYKSIISYLGCGKSSIIAMIERFYDPVEGNILFDGADIKQMNPRWYHR